MSNNTNRTNRYELARQLYELSDGREYTVVGMAASAVEKYLELRAELKGEATRVADRMTKLVASLEAGYQVNSLGELQTNRVDMLCAQSQQALEDLKRLVYAVRQSEGDDLANRLMELASL